MPISRTISKGMDETQITGDIIVFPRTIHGAWSVFVSIYMQTQIMIIARHRAAERTLCEVFYHPEDAAEFIEFLDINEDYNE